MPEIAMHRLSFFRRIPIALLFLLALAVISGLFVAKLRPSAIPMAAYKLHVLTFAGLIGWWMDHVLLFPYARPSGYLERDWRAPKWIDPNSQRQRPVFPVLEGARFLFAAANYRRALVVVGFVIAAALVL